MALAKAKRAIFPKTDGCLVTKSKKLKTSPDTSKATPKIPEAHKFIPSIICCPVGFASARILSYKIKSPTYSPKYYTFYGINWSPK